MIISRTLNYYRVILKGAVVNQTLRILLPVTVISSLAVMMQCANPVDEPPLRWESKVQVPISNKDFNLKKEFDNIFSLLISGILNL